jgi:hypothetical protein
LDSVAIGSKSFFLRSAGGLLSPIVTTRLLRPPVDRATSSARPMPDSTIRASMAKTLCLKGDEPWILR